MENLVVDPQLAESGERGGPHQRVTVMYQRPHRLASGGQLGKSVGDGDPYFTILVRGRGGDGTRIIHRDQRPHGFDPDPVIGVAQRHNIGNRIADTSGTGYIQRGAAHQRIGSADVTANRSGVLQHLDQFTQPLGGSTANRRIVVAQRIQQSRLIADGNMFGQ
ncbi:Uncharacterised protein [Mycobacteroides abscessus]|nr:Uncharacterised protein [Mycobacteroides abscessus]